MKKNSVQVSVVMPNYNAWKYISEAIESVLNQDFDNFEFIIVDDGSTDESREIIGSYARQDNRIIFLQNPKNLGIAPSLNRAIKIAKWEYIARMDSDDKAHKDWLKTVYTKIISDSRLGVCGTNLNIVDTDWKIKYLKEYPRTNQECRNTIWMRNPFAHNSVIIRKEVLEKVWYYDNDMLFAEDFDLWIRIGQYYTFYNIQEFLINYRIYEKNSICIHQKEMIRSTLRVRKKAIKLWYKIGIFGRVFYFWTWCAQFMPSKWVLGIFNFIYTKKNTF